MKLPPFVVNLQKWIGALRRILNAGNAAGLWPSQEATPRFMVRNTPPPQGFLSPVTAIKNKVKEKVVEVGIKNIQKKIDTPEERKTIIDGIHVPGLPARFTWVLSALGAVATAVLAAVSQSDPSLLIAGEWRAWAASVIYSVDWQNLWQAASTFIGLKIAFWTKQDSHNSTAVIPSKVVKGIGEALPPQE
jgi:hypothetical protein